jgi:lipoprotein-releasing system ATP-binding protein
MLLSCRNLHKRFASGESGTLTILDGIDLDLDTGESVAITGPSGSGKSTLLNLIGTLETPDEGTITFDGRELSGLAEPERARFRAESLGFVFQLHHLLPQLTLLENVLVPLLALHSHVPAQARERATALLTRVGLGERLQHRPGQLSGGERQRTALARALVHRPRLLLADEPTGSLDQASSGEVADLIAELQRDEGLTLLVASHAPDLAGRMQRRYTLKGGTLEALKPAP